MSSDIVTFLHLEKLLSSRVVVVKEINKCDSCFVTSCVLGHCIKNKIPVIVVLTHNSLQHYHNVGLKMNYNLQRNIEAGLIQCIDFGKHCITNLLTNNTLPPLFGKIQESINSMTEKYGKVSVILDGVSHLFDLNYSLKEINAFCKDIIESISAYHSFVVFHCNEADEHDATHVLANLLAHQAHTILEARNLTSGWSTDVSGHLTIKQPGQKFDDEHLYAIDAKPSQYLFKLFDRGVKLFAPGTV